MNLKPTDLQSQIPDSSARTLNPNLNDSEIAISIRNLTKVYKLYDAPMDRLKESLHPLRRKYHHDFHALHDVSFDVKCGDTVAVIGKNGSGKSTLLKIITGVLTPSSGTASVKGTVSALLELGAGFNPELTGIDNVYFNGTLMGFSKNEIDQKLDSILSFADIGEFVYQPVKMYSSGMFVRLAFAMAINVDPDVLIVDEALSVGDAAFRRKCYSRILDFQARGKTILFVSHSSEVVIELCNRAVLIDSGELLMSDVPKRVTSQYQKLINASPETAASLRDTIRGAKCLLDAAAHKEITEEQYSYKESQKPDSTSGNRAYFDQEMTPKSTVYYESRGAKISNPVITTLEGEVVNVLQRGQEYNYCYNVTFTQSAYKVRFGVTIKTISGLVLGGLLSHPEQNGIDYVEKGSVIKRQFKFKCILLPGVYFMNSGLVGNVEGEEVFLHRVIDITMFRVQSEPGLLSTGLIDFSAPDPQKFEENDIL